MRRVASCIFASIAVLVGVLASSGLSAAPAHASATPTVPLLTGGLFTMTGSGTASSSYSDDAQAIRWDGTFPTSTSSFLMPILYHGVPSLDPSNYDFPTPQCCANYAVSWPSDPGSVSGSVTLTGLSPETCETDLTGTRGTYSLGAAVPGTTTLRGLAPFSFDDNPPDIDCPTTPDDMQQGLGTWAGDVIGTIADAPSGLDLSSGPAATAPQEVNVMQQDVHVDAPVDGWSSCADDQPDCSSSSQVTWDGTLSLHCLLCVQDISFKQVADPSSTDDSLGDVPDGGTYDGNRVEIDATIDNIGPKTITTNINFVDQTSGRTLPEAAGTTLVQPVALAPGVQHVKFEWDTSGFAWESGTPHTSRRVEVLTPLGGAYRDITVLPKPIVLVHGWNSHASTWDDMKTMIQGITLAWKGYAVGDNAAWSAPMDTDPVSGVSVDSNAFTEGRYIEGLRKDTGAQHVDIVAHSMGGLISRDYIANLMPGVPQPPDNQPVATHLVMLGTPNQGSPCAIPASNLAAQFGDGTPTKQLRPDFVADQFDQAVTAQHGVQFSVMAGTGYKSCSPDEGDGVVSVKSAWWHYTDVAKKKDFHTQLPGDGEILQSFIKPRLALDPTQAHPGGGSATAAPASTGSPTTADVAATPDQLAVSQQSTIDPGATLTVKASSDHAKDLEAILTAPSTVAMTLKHKTSVFKQKAGSGPAEQPIRSILVKKPANGVWTLSLTNTGATPAPVMFGIALQNPATRLQLTSTQAPDGTLTICGTPTTGGAPQHGATITAHVRGTPTDLGAISLTDDGTGTYCATTSSLPADSYFVVAQAQIGTITRATGELSASA
jgi:pimeloyl-ACP methyl ester carboxylesterase